MAGVIPLHVFAMMGWRDVGIVTNGDCLVTGVLEGLKRTGLMNVRYLQVRYVI
jgi:hypothetical protein